MYVNFSAINRIFSLAGRTVTGIFDNPTAGHYSNGQRTRHSNMFGNGSKVVSMAGDGMGDRAYELRTEIETYNLTVESKSKISNRTLDALQRELIDTEMVSTLDAEDFKKLDITVAEKKILQRWLSDKDKKDLWRPLDPVRIDFLIYSYVLGFVIMAPALIIGLIQDDDKGPLDPSGYEHTGIMVINVSTGITDIFSNVEDDLDGFGGKILRFGGTARGGTVLIPAIAALVISAVTLGIFRGSLGKDLMEQSSPGVSVRESQRSNLTNCGMVGALFLTIVIAMLQVFMIMVGIIYS
jgi:hypothetical protein